MKLSKQNVLYIARAPVQGGTENVVLQLCEIFKPLVNKIVVCAGKGFDQQKLKELGIKFYEIPDLENKSLKNLFLISYKLKSIVKKERITVIHTHHRMAAFYVTLLRLYKRCIFINTSHNTFYNKIKLTRFSYKHAHLIACGKAVKKNLKDVFGLKKITVIYNAVKPFNGPIKKEPILSEWHKIGYFLIANVGRLTKQKGFKYFIDSIPLVLKKYPKTKFIIIGSGELENQLKVQARKLKVKNNIVWLGYREDIQNLMSQVDLVVLSSLWEGLPLTPIEAFSVGKPVIGSSISGTREEIINGINGYLFKSKNSADLANKIEQFISLDNNDKLSKQALITYHNKYSINFFKTRMINYYKNLNVAFQIY